MAERKKVGLTRTEKYTALEDLQQAQKLTRVTPINLDYCGREQCLPGYSFGPFVRVSYVIHIVVSGKGRLMKSGGAVHEVHAGQAFLIYPKEELVYQADQIHPWEYMWIGFHGFEAEEMMNRIGFQPKKPVITCPNLNSLQKAMERMLDVRELTYKNELYRMSALYYILALLMENRKEEDSLSGLKKESENLDQVYVQMAVDLLLGSYKRKVKVTDVAKAIGISRNYLTTIFKKEMNVSPQEFLINYRMEKAASLLTNTKEQVHVIGAEVGYSDSLAFSKAFRTHYGMSPTEYREHPPHLQTYTEKGKYTSDIPL